MIDRSSPAAHRAVLGREAMRALDEYTFQNETESIELMERAGHGISNFLLDSLPDLLPNLDEDDAPAVLIFCGPGNNGGDGYVMARVLAEQQCDVCVVEADEPPDEDSDAGANRDLWIRMEGTIASVDDGIDWMERPENFHRGIMVDAIFGTGLVRDLGPKLAATVSLINLTAAAGVPVISVDTPSGLSADTGRPLGCAVIASATATIGAAKPGLFVGSGPDYAGRIEVIDIGLADPVSAGIEAAGEIIHIEACRDWLPVRRATVHKTQVGHVCIVAGSRGKIGAAILAARGALRAGAGLVTVALPASESSALATALPEAMTITYDDQERGLPTTECWEDVAREQDKFDVLVVGPGIGTSEGAGEFVVKALAEFRGRIIMDADALNVVAGDRRDFAGKLRDRRSRELGDVIITPHPGEMARLANRKPGEVQGDRIAACKAFCRRHPVILVLKGAGTLIHDGQRMGFNCSGNPGMAAPGMGDVLAGALGALAGVIESPFEAAALAVHAHGLAGDLLAFGGDGPGFFASELADAIPEAIAVIQEF